ncbi:MAG: hypothetical protein HC902_04025 [Calothrix sp. SM1_5_4]|nr:hypothetical protein [Calothrix sp. SM1_5_4]
MLVAGKDSRIDIGADGGEAYAGNRATVIGAQVSARSLPADDGVGLFDLSGGHEVLVRRVQDGWTQVRNSEGATGLGEKRGPSGHLGESERYELHVGQSFSSPG